MGAIVSCDGTDVPGKAGHFRSVTVFNACHVSLVALWLIGISRVSAVGSRMVSDWVRGDGFAGVENSLSSCTYVSY